MVWVRREMSSIKSMNVMKEQSYNKEIALSFYKDVVGRRDMARANEIIAEDYIQHNPTLKAGRAGVLEAIEYLKKMPMPPAGGPSPIRRVIADGDFVALHLVVDVMGKRKYVVDLFRLRHGLLTEHWDAIQEAPVSDGDSLSLIDGPTAVEDLHLTDINKEIVRVFAGQILVGRDCRLLSESVSDVLVQHDPRIDQGLHGLRDFLTRDSSFRWIKLHRIIGEGNLVVIQSEVLVDERPFVRYDLFRLSDRKIVEQWSVQQAVPDVMMHDNGMI
jgi:predicted SnoaL-like aldol condensation-catalyzing enzyme